MNQRTFTRSLPLFALLIALSSHSARACAACYANNTGSKMGDAANWGIIAMAIIMFAMLGAIGAFAYYLSWRAKNPLPDYDELLSDNETDPLPDPS